MAYLDTVICTGWWHYGSSSMSAWLVERILHARVYTPNSTRFARIDDSVANGTHLISQPHPNEFGVFNPFTYYKMLGLLSVTAAYETHVNVHTDVVGRPVSVLCALWNLVWVHKAICYNKIAVVAVFVSCNCSPSDRNEMWAEVSRTSSTRWREHCMYTIYSYMYPLHCTLIVIVVKCEVLFTN